MMKTGLLLSVKTLLAFVVLIAAVPMSFADEYSTTHGVGVRTSYDDNINGSRDNPQSGTAQIISPSLKTTWATENANTDIDLNLDFYRYNRPGYDTDNQRVSLNNRWAYTESQQVSLLAEIIRDSTSTSEAQVQDTGVSVLERVSERRIQKSFAPSWSWQFTELDSFGLNYRYSEVDYGDLANSGYTGNEQYSITPSISHSLREDWSVFIQGEYSQSDTDSRDLFTPLSIAILNGPYAGYTTKTTTNGLAIGSNFQISETWSLNGYVGQNKSDGEYDITVAEGSGLDVDCVKPENQIFEECRALVSLKDYSANGGYSNISLKWTQELWEASIAFNSNVFPSSEGYSQQSDRWTLSSAYELSEKLSLSASFEYVENTSVTEETQSALGVNSDREITSFRLGCNYRLREDWSLNASYAKDQTDYPRSRSLGSYSIESESFLVGLQWRPNKMVWAN